MLLWWYFCVQYIPYSLGYPIDYSKYIRPRQLPERLEMAIYRRGGGEVSWWETDNSTPLDGGCHWGPTISGPHLIGPLNHLHNALSNKKTKRDWKLLSAIVFLLDLILHSAYKPYYLRLQLCVLHYLFSCMYYKHFYTLLLHIYALQKEKKIIYINIYYIYNLIATALERLKKKIDKKKE